MSAVARRKAWAGAAALVVCVVVVVVVAVAVALNRPADHYGGPPVPSHGAYVGAWVHPDPYTQAGRIRSVAGFEAATGADLDIIHVYRRWGEQFGTDSDLAFAREGKYLLISWATPDTTQLVSGRDDAGIARAAREIAALPTKVFLEVRWEMDRPNLSGVVHGPEDYIAAWARVRRIFADQHVTNVAWVWCPTAAGFASGVAQRYYPGNSAVDWVCADVYPTKAFEPNAYQSFGSLAAPFVGWAEQHHKPMIIGEFAVDVAYGSRRAGWIDQAASYIRAHADIKAVAWFEQSLPTDPVYRHWSLDGDPSGLAAFGRLAGSVAIGKDG